MNDLEVPELFPFDLLPYEAKLLLDAVRMAVDVPDIADSDLELYERMEGQLAAIARTGRFCTCRALRARPDRLVRPGRTLGSSPGPRPSSHSTTP